MNLKWPSSHDNFAYISELCRSTWQLIKIWLTRDVLGQSSIIYQSLRLVDLSWFVLVSVTWSTLPKPRFEWQWFLTLALVTSYDGSLTLIGLWWVGLVMWCLDHWSVIVDCFGPAVLGQFSLWWFVMGGPDGWCDVLTIGQSKWTVLDQKWFVMGGPDGWCLGKGEEPC